MSTNFVDSLLSKIDDESLRDQLTNEFNKLRDNKKFGLVFERHIPEYVRLYKRKITEGAHVQLRTSKSDDIFTVREIKGKTARIADKDDSMRNEKIDDLVVVIRHGDPIYPGLVEVDRVERGGDKPFHTVINAENYHALQLLLYTHEGKIDCIYIDPPYNTGAKDWKYNNDYVDSEDRYRHSKWLSFMEKRLTMSKKLLNPENSFLLVTIDEKEYLRLGLLLSQIFPLADIQMVTTVINPGGSVRDGSFSRVEEYIFIVRLGEATINPLPLKSEWRGGKSTSTVPVTWRSLNRGGDENRRVDRPNMFYPIFVNDDSPSIHSIGDSLPIEADRSTVICPVNTHAIWPMVNSEQEGRWRVSVETSRLNLNDGMVRVLRKSNGVESISYLGRGVAEQVRLGEIPNKGKDSNGVIILGELPVAKIVPGSSWNITSHNSRDHGSSLLKKFIPGRIFPYPKSLYAVEDVLRFCVYNNPEARILDFFAGSGTTAHAVMRLNREDDGNRVSISVTNNSISAEEEEHFRKLGLNESSDEWETSGIFHNITMPRISAAVTGQTFDGSKIKGSYKFGVEFPISDGFEENIRFLELGFVDYDIIQRNRSFDDVSNILWLKSGGKGSVIKQSSSSFAIQEEGNYGVLFNISHMQEFVDEVKQVETMTHAFIVTDSKVQYQQVVKHLPTNIKTTMLYEDYLRNFQIGV